MVLLSRSAPERILVGEVLRSHGVAGWVVVKPIGTDPERFLALESVFLGEILYPVEKVRVVGRAILLKLAGVEDANQAAELRGKLIFILFLQRLPLPEGQYFIDDLIGFAVVTTEGQVVGRLAEVWSMPANDVLVVRTPEEGQVLIPALKSAVRAIESEDRRIVVEAWSLAQ
ncbi:MAG: ribosome maturation factor RimM [Coprothermobacterota bacterium]|nr:ribosome maturation factor RimM [Coprothermobacterota bacterium]